MKLKYGLIGYKINYSQSPELHLTAAKLCGLDISYDLIDIGPDEFSTRFPELLESDYSGFNITQPYKEEVAQYFSSNLKSVNTLFKSKGVWNAHSTDGEGLIYAGEQNGIDFCKHSTICILGNGGVTLSLVEALQAQNPSTKIHIVRRNKGRDNLFCSYKNISFYDFEPERLGNIITQDNQSLLIQATSAPLRGDNLMSFAGALENFKGVYIEMLYGQHKSALFDTCVKKGLMALDGLECLKGQALLAQKIWWGRCPNYRELS